MSAARQPARIARVGAPSEHAEAAMLMRAVRGAEPEHPELAFFAAVPNGGKRSKRTAVDLKAEGVRPGVPDYLWPCAKGGYVGLAIELKRLRGGRVEPEQRTWITHLLAQGWRVEVCRGWEQAWAVVRDYLALDAEVGA